MKLTEESWCEIEKTVKHLVRWVIVTPALLYVTRDWHPYYRGSVVLLLVLMWSLWVVMAVCTGICVYLDPLRRREE